MAVARATGAFEFVKGEDAQINWTIQTSETDTTPKDITGWALELTIKRRASDSGASVATTTSSVVSGAAGTASTTIAAAVTGAMDGDYEYDLWRTNSGAYTCLSSGTFSIVDTVRN
jgi:hypothetical protein